MKFSARPCGVASPFAEISTPNFLRKNMQNHLAQGEACFDFLIQLRKHPWEMPIEDPTIEWSEKASPFIPVARIIIPVQTFTSPEQLEFCENLSFTPWHAIPEHQPLGGINRVRKRSMTRFPVFAMNSMPTTPRTNRLLTAPLPLSINN